MECGLLFVDRMTFRSFGAGRRAVTVALGIALLGSPSREGRAEEVERLPPPDGAGPAMPPGAAARPVDRSLLVPIRIETSEPRLSYTIDRASPDGPEHDTPADACVGACSFELVAGHYRVRLHDEDGRLLAVEEIVVTEPKLFTLSRPRPAVASVGLVIGIGGSALALGGLIAVSIASSSNACGGNCASSSPAGTIGLAALLTGGLAIPVGWTMFVKGRKWLDEQQVVTNGQASRGGRLRSAREPLGAPASPESRAPTFGVALVPAPGGASFMGMVRF